MRNYIFHKTTITTFAFILFCITVIAAISIYIAIAVNGNETRLRRHISGHTPEIVLTAISNHIDQNEEALYQHIQKSQDRLDQHINQAEISLEEVAEQTNQLFGELIPAE